MSTPDTQADAVLTLHFPQQIAAEMERTAQAENMDLSALLRSGFRALKAERLRLALARIRPEQPISDREESQIQAYVDEVREEIYRARSL